MSDSQREIAAHLGSAFAAVAARFLPAITEALERARPGQKVSFGARVECRLRDTVIEVRLKPSEPKIPTEPMPPIHIVLKRDRAGQLEFLFQGSVEAMKKAARESEGPAWEPSGDYESGGNATRHDAAGDTTRRSGPPRLSHPSLRRGGRG